MTSKNTAKVAAAVASCTTGFFLAFMATASPAGADPVDPAAPALPTPAVVVPAPPPDTTIQAADPAPAPLPPNGTPHLASPDALPPGATLTPQDDDSPNVSYLRDIWQAVQNHEISGKEALLLGLAQRGMDTPIPAQAPGPNVPITPGDDPAPLPTP